MNQNQAFDIIARGLPIRMYAGYQWLYHGGAYWGYRDPHLFDRMIDRENLGSEQVMRLADSVDKILACRRGYKLIGPLPDLSALDAPALRVAA